LLQQADKKANSASSSGFASFFTGSSSSSKLEDARELYNSAANAFKLEKSFKESGDAFVKAGDCATKAGEKDDAALDYWNAAKAYKKTHPELAVRALKLTIQLYVEKGRFRQAADREKDIAEIYKQDGGDMQAAMEAYEQAGDWYAGEDATATANSCYKETAEIAALLDHFDKAIDKFELVAQASLASNLTRYSVKEYYFKAGLCHLCRGDVVQARRALDHYQLQDNTFPGTRECKFLVAVTDAVDAGDQESFTQLVVDFDNVMKLDNWKTQMLLKVRKTIQEEPGLV